jgi:hypothetical protein
VCLDARMKMNIVPGVLCAGLRDWVGFFCSNGYSGAIAAAARTGNGSEACLGECIPLFKPYFLLVSFNPECNETCIIPPRGTRCVHYARPAQ